MAARTKDAVSPIERLSLQWNTRTKVPCYREQRGILQVFGGRKKSLQRAGQHFGAIGIESCGDRHKPNQAIEQSFRNGK